MLLVLNNQNSEYASGSECASICEYNSSEYGLGCEYVRILNIPGFLSMPGFLICKGPE